MVQYTAECNVIYTRTFLLRSMHHSSSFAASLVTSGSVSAPSLCSPSSERGGWTVSCAIVNWAGGEGGGEEGERESWWTSEG